jgi:hypothetical protein
MKKYQKRRLIWLGLMAVVFLLVLAAGAVSMRTQTLRTRVEEAKYTLVEQRTGYELREYAPQVQAKILVEGEAQLAVVRGFDTLNAYLFGHNRITPTEEGGRDRQRIGFTTPVWMWHSEAPEPEGHWVAVTLPSRFDLNNAPEPRNENIALVEKPPFEAAVIRFNGWGTMEDMREHEALLRALMEKDGIEIAGPPLYARYDPPWIVPIFRRNEVLIPVQH